MWLIKLDGTRVGVGEAPFAFTAQENGEGNYMIRLAEPGLTMEAYQKLEVLHHPTGDATRLDDAVPVLEAKMSDRLPIEKEPKK
jgi:hypothetical protein